MIEKIGAPGFETLSKPDQIVLDLLTEILANEPNVTVYEVGVGVGATTLPMASLMANKGNLVLFSRLKDVKELAQDLRSKGFNNIDDRWGSASNTYSGYHFELAKAFVDNLLPKFDLGYIDGGHVFHLDAPATCVLKELCKKGGYLVFDDWGWSLGKSPTLNPKVHPATSRDYDESQIETCHVQLVCKIVMDTDNRFEFIKLENNSAVYRRIS